MVTHDYFPQSVINHKVQASETNGLISLHNILQATFLPQL